MEVTLHPFSLIILFGIGTALPLVLLLWMVPWGNRSANKFLSLLLASCSSVATVHLVRNELVFQPLAFDSLFSLQLTIAPLMYFFTCHLTQPNYRWRWQHGWHFLPAVLMAVIWQLQLPLSADGILNPPCLTAADVANRACEPYYLSRFVHRITTHLSVIIYAIAALCLLRPHLQRVKANYSSIEDVNLRWLQILICLFLAAGGIDFTLELQGVFWPPRGLPTGLLLALAPLALSLLMGGFGLLQRNIQLNGVVTSAQPVARTLDRPDTTEKKYQTSSLTQEGANEIWQRLQHVMTEQHPHLETGLKIADLAAMVRVPPHHLSETINSCAQQSFYEFINHYRVEEAARLLTAEDQSHSSITDIGLQAGFNSNSTFFSHFKKRFEQTPRQFRQRQSKNITY